MRGSSPLALANISVLNTYILAVPFIPVQLLDVASILNSSHVYWLWWGLSLRETVYAKLLLSWGSSVYLHISMYLSYIFLLHNLIHPCLLELSYSCMQLCCLTSLSICGSDLHHVFFLKWHPDGHPPSLLLTDGIRASELSEINWVRTMISGNRLQVSRFEHVILHRWGENEVFYMWGKSVEGI